MPEPEPDPERAFLIELYGRNREHELELNRIQAAMSRTLIGYGIVGNGAAAATYAGLIKAGTAGLGAWAVVAVLLWALGLVVGFLAVRSAHAGQRAFTMAYRSRRLAIEHHLLGGRHARLRGTDRSLEALAADADTARKQGTRLLAGGFNGGLVAGYLFLAGLGAAVLSLLRPPTTVEAAAVLAPVTLAALGASILWYLLQQSERS